MGPKDNKKKTEEVAVEEPQVDNKKAKKGKIPEPVKKAVNGDKKAATKKPVESDSDDTSDDDTSSDEDTKKTAAKKTVAPVKAAVPQKAAATKKVVEPSSSDEDSSDEEETAVAGKRKAQPLTTQEKKVQPITKKAKAESSDESSDDSEDEKPVKKVEAKKAEAKKPEPKKPEVKKVAAKGKQESSEEDSDEESSEEETKKATTKAQPAKVVAKKQESSEEDDDEDDEEEEKEQKQPQEKAATNTQMRDVEGSGKTELYVANLSYGTTEDNLYEFFGNYGEVVNVKLLKNPQGQSKGTAFVEFGSSEDASKALASNGEDLQGRQIRVNFSGERAQGAPGGDGFQGGRQGGYQGGNQQSFSSGPRNDAATIFVGNLPFRASVESIKEYFGQIGEVKDVRLAKDESGKLRGFGHVEFAAESSVDGAIGLNGQSFEGRDLKVDRSNSKGGSGGRGGFGGGRGGFGGGRGGFGGGRGGFGGGRGGFGGGRGRGGFGNRPNIDSDRQSAQKGTIADFQGTKMKF